MLLRAEIVRAAIVLGINMHENRFPCSEMLCMDEESRVNVLMSGEKDAGRPVGVLCALSLFAYGEEYGG